MKCFNLQSPVAIQQKQAHNFILLQYYQDTYEGESKIKDNIYLTVLIEVTVSNFTYHFST